MSSARLKYFYFIILILILSELAAIVESTIDQNETISGSATSTLIPEGRSLFSPRIDYNNKWMPVGRGDPLKNDPTYDYSPPVLDRVRYWGDGSANKQEILVLGVSAKKPSHRKVDTTQPPIRRNYFPQLPTVLMPPPVQTLPSAHYNAHNKENLQLRHPMDNIWPPKVASLSDATAEESSNIVNVARPNSSNKQQSDPVPYDPYQTYSSTYTSGQRKPWIHNLLNKEVTRPTTFVKLEKTPNRYESYSSIETTTYFTPTVPPPPAMNDDFNTSIFEEPRPMYLIIQGHSKVKTYGQPDDGEKKPPKIVPVEKGEHPISPNVRLPENKIYTEVRHLHNSEINALVNETKTDRPSGSGGLLSLLDTSFGDFLLSNEEEPQKDLALNVNEIPQKRKISFREERQQIS